ncbi:DUF1993 domain-containing protein [Arenimonas terrae]|jgi:hypothetical protein|uniref:DUF1993 domain-containing protein n=1 Tax=Arenimonas terrae TaxID=2546226 RepID=A0A5C4RRW1_9GAMM|nr:DUF1993 domain-containing protein [Arenimonas terrae]TNJ33571.1 DUF1993 domain-containing protein [Arenimonas terrae]
MTLSMSALTLPAVERALTNLSAILDKGLTHAKATGIDPDTLVQARLAPDMLTLAGQVQRASDSAKGLVARLAGVDNPSMADDETSFAQLQDRIARTLAFVRGVDRKLLDGSETRTVTLPVRGQTITLGGQAYLMGFALPNIHFHVTTAYAILRHNGAPLGKLDYLGPLA